MKFSRIIILTIMVFIGKVIYPEGLSWQERVTLYTNHLVLTRREEFF